MSCIPARWCSRLSWLPHPTRTFTTRGIERARCVDEAVDVITSLLRTYGQSGFKRMLAYHNSYLIADNGGAAVLETVEREWVLRRAHDVDALSNVISIQSTFDGCSKTCAPWRCF
jgi:hypothetical protein